jgi:hypothetical protein
MTADAIKQIDAYYALPMVKAKRTVSRGDIPQVAEEKHRAAVCYGEYIRVRNMVLKEAKKRGKTNVEETPVKEDAPVKKQGSQFTKVQSTDDDDDGDPAKKFADTLETSNEKNNPEAETPRGVTNITGTAKLKKVKKTEKKNLKDNSKGKNK